MTKASLIFISAALIVGCASTGQPDRSQKNTAAANALCAEKFGEGVKATHYYYTGEPSINAIGLHCGNNPYKQERIKISRAEWEGKLRS